MSHLFTRGRMDLRSSSSELNDAASIPSNHLLTALSARDNQITTWKPYRVEGYVHDMRTSK